MEFQDIDLSQFNWRFDTDIDEDDTFEQITIKLDREEVSIFYISLDPNDVVEAIENEQDMADRLGVLLYKVGGGQFYIATY